MVSTKEKNLGACRVWPRGAPLCILAKLQREKDERGGINLGRPKHFWIADMCGQAPRALITVLLL